MVSGWITCHCGQHVPAYLAGRGKHVTPNGGACYGINLDMHVTGICLECLHSSHSAEFMATLDMIREG